MELVQALKTFGLTEHEADTYLALLQLGPSPVLAISRRTNIKRPTLYLILDDLITKGLVARVPHEKKKFYLALPPDRLEEELERRSRLIQGALPELSALHRSQTAKPSIQIFESKEGMLSLYHEITAPQKGEVLGFFSLEAVPEEFMESFDVFIRALKEKKMKLREIAYPENRNHFYIQKVKNLPNHEVRFTTGQFRFLTDNFIYGNKVALFSFKKRFALVIESEDVATSFRSLFELAWQSAKKF